jgi:hypothetical protein
MSLFTKKFKITRSESFFLELEEPQNEMDVTDGNNPATKTEAG